MSPTEIKDEVLGGQPSLHPEESGQTKTITEEEYSRLVRLGCTVERRGGDTEALRDLNDGDVGIGHQRIAAARKLQRLARRWPIRDSA